MTSPAGATSATAAHARQRTHQHSEELAEGDGAKTVFFLKKSPRHLAVYVAGLRKTPKTPAAANDYSLSGNKVTFVAAPGAGAKIIFDMASV